MSELVTREYYGVPGWAWGLGVVIVAGGSVWILHEYFVAPGEAILNQYKAILEDIYRESKQFLETNEPLGIYGLTAAQEAILAAKEKAADKLRPEVEQILIGREVSVWTWVETAIVGFLLIYGITEVLPGLLDKLKNWRTQNPEASSKTASQYGHGHLLFELVATEYALAGKLNIASAFYNTNIPSIYQAYTYPALTSQIAYYYALLPTLTPGTLNYLVAQQMLGYLIYEADATTGIMALLHSWWLPPLF